MADSVKHYLEDDHVEASSRVSINEELQTGQESKGSDIDSKPSKSSPYRDTAILVIDDDEQVLKVTKELLARGGYIVQTAATGIEGLAILNQLGREIGLVLLDMNLPQMDGTEISKGISSIHPGVPIVLMSGDSEDELKSSAQSLGLAGCIGKPFRSRHLLEQVEKASK